MNSPVQTLSILLIGSREVGKSKLLDRLNSTPFTEFYDMTENNTQQTFTLQLESNTFLLNITQMSKVLFKVFEVQPLPHFDYIIFAYDLSKSSSWHDVRKYKEQLEKYIGEDSQAKYFIIGNKSDKENLMDSSKIKFFAPHIELSAKSDSLNPKEVCLEIWNRATMAKILNKKPIQPAQIPEHYVETPFNVSIPTSITRIEGQFNNQKVIKIMLLGNANVGKTEISSCLINEPFKEEYMQTIGVDFRVLNIRCNGANYRLQCWDLSGGEKFRLITQVYYKMVNISLYVYDVTNRASFEAIRQFYTDMSSLNVMPAEQYSSILIGNKVDLANQRQVSYEEGAMMAAQINSKFYETSLKQRSGIMEAILTTVQEFINEKKLD